MMKNRYVKIAVLCFCTLTVSLSAFFAANETQARIINTASWKNVYTPYSEKQESNYLTEDGTVVTFEDWSVNASRESTKSAVITITAPKKTSGKLTCVSDSDCIIPSLDEYEITVDDKGRDVKLLLKLGQPALLLEEEITVSINVKWTPDDSEQPELKATFVVLLRPKDPQVAAEDSVGLISNYLDRNGHTIVLEDWTINSLAYRMKEITFSLDSGEVSGILECTCDSELIKAELDASKITVTNLGYIAKLMLTPYESALNITEETAVTVRVNWKELPKFDADGNIINADAPPIMWADIKVNLKPGNVSASMVDVSDTNENVPPETGGTEADILWSENDSFVWTDAVDVKVNAVNGIQHVYLTYNGGSFPEGTCYSADKNTYDPVDDYIYLFVPEWGYQEISIDFSGAEMLAPEKILLAAKAESAGVTYVDALELTPKYEIKDGEVFDHNNIPAKVASNNAFTLNITAPKSADTLELFYNDGKFPIGTSYFVDNNDPVTLGDEATISISVFSEENLTVTFDFTRADMTEVTEVSISTKAYNYGAEFATDGFTAAVYKETVDALFDVESCPETFSNKEYLTLDLTAPLDSETMEFRLNGGAFPKGTRYSINSDEFVTLADDMKINSEVEPGEKIRFVLDFSEVELKVVNIPDTEDQTGIIISASAYIGNRKIEEGSVATSPTRAPLTADYETAKMLIEKAGELTVSLTGVDETLQLTVEQLVIKEGKTVRITSEDWFGLSVTVTESGTLTVSNKEQKAAAGSYLITFVREHNGVELRRIEIPLFIYY